PELGRYRGIAREVLEADPCQQAADQIRGQRAERDRGKDLVECVAESPAQQCAERGPDDDGDAMLQGLPCSWQARRPAAEGYYCAGTPEFASASCEAFQPPPTAEIRSTLETRRWLRMPSRLISADRRAVCAVSSVA